MRNALVVLLAAGQLFSSLPTQSAATDRDKRSVTTTATTRAVKVNRTVPKVSPPPETPSFSAHPTDEQITRARIFDEPLLRTDESPVERRSFLNNLLDGLFNRRRRSQRRENQLLAEALLKYVNASDGEDVSSLTDFLGRFPESGWRASLLVNLGAVYRRTGYFTKAMNAFEDAWRFTKDGRGKNTRAIANRVAGELAEMHAHLGHAERLNVLFADLKGRDLYGPTTEKVTAAKESLWRARHLPEDNFRCGPAALARIRVFQNLPDDDAILKARATPHGMSLKQVADLARRAGMRFQMARREVGAKLIAPAVVHWKVDHYAAIIARREERGREYFLVENPLFEKELWVSREALDEETSGYYLVPEGSLPVGWRVVAEAEAASVFGRCYSGVPDYQQTTCYAVRAQTSCPLCPCDDPTSGGAQTSPMAEYSFHALLVSLNIVDQPLGYTPPRGPAVRFIATYNQREAFQPTVFSFSNMGPKWTSNWLAYVTDTADTTSPNGLATVYLRGGGQETYTFYGPDPMPKSGGVHHQSQAELIAVSFERNRSAVYERRLPDGSKEVFGQSDGVTRGDRKVFLTQIVDPAGNAIRFTYDSRLRVVAVTDALGQVTTLAYELPADPLKITKVTDPFGRSATLMYDSQGRLVKITDIIGITSEFNYVDGDFVSSLKTPYGRTNFRTGSGPEPNSPRPEVSRYLQATDPLGETERLEYWVRVPGRSGELGGNLYWDKRAWKETPKDANGIPTDYTKATLYRWMLGTIAGAGGNLDSGVKYYEKLPLEGEIRYGYPKRNPQDSDDQLRVPNTPSLPIKISRTLDDGSVQTYQYQYNERGNVTQFTDPAGRRFSFAYDANKIDLLEAYNDNTNEVLARLSYNSQHLPLTYTDAADQTTTLTYNPQGQLTSITNPKGETTTLTYDGSGYLIRVTGPVAGAVTQYSYDGFGRVQSVTDSEGYRITIEYDALDRPAKITYPDGTFEQTTYTLLDATQIRDRLGRIAQVEYDALRRPVSITDPLARVTKLGWCNCGDLSQLTDPAGNTTTWNRDVRGRVTSKVLADGTQTRYVYETNTSRLKQIIDAEGQTINYAYTTDDNVRRISFDKAEVPTTAVTFAYDPNYDRLVSMQDGVGMTSYSYHPVGRLGALQPAAVDGPLDNDTITYGYDELGRALSQAVNGVASRWTFDALGRVTSETNPLGSFAMTYVRATNRLSTLRYPNGQTTMFSYFDNRGDQQLQQIKHQTSTQGLLSQFDYTYLATGEVQSLTRQLPQLSPAQSSFTFSYDAASQLTGAMLSGGGPSLVNYAYSYDAAGNRTREQINAAVNQAAFNNTNQLVMLQQGARARQLTYDANGNLTSDGLRRFDWDALDRLTAVVTGNHRSEFSYDGLDRRTRIVEKENGAIVSDKRLVWCGSAMCEERTIVGNATAVMKRFFAEGETAVTGGVEMPYFYTRDHLGSVREMTDRSGNVVASYEYDPWGRMTKVNGAKEASFGYADYYVHAPSGLNLTVYRAYDSELGRWLSRDPIGENSGVNGYGINLYAYGRNNPTTLIDPLGLAESCPDPTLQAILNFEYGIQDVLSLGLSSVVRPFTQSEFMDPNYASSLPYSVGVLAGNAFLIGGIFRAAFPITVGLKEVTITRWGGGLESGRWVQIGTKNLWDYIKTGLWSRPARPPLSSGITYKVPKECLAPPPKELPGWIGTFAQWYKWAIGHRIYIGPPR
jgi:RHS repeat-associated protein